jgi:nucleoside-diphosphate-sugar epimerase
MARNQPIRIYGDGTAQYQYCYIDDIIRANLSAMHWLSDPNHTFLMANISGHSASVNTLAELINSEFPEYDKCPEYAKPRYGEQTSITMNGRIAEIELNWKPSISLEEGVLRVVQATKEEAAKGQANE